MREKIVLAYSGGLDTTVAVKWLQEERGYDVVCLNVNLGMSREQSVLEERAAAGGALRVEVADAQDTFLKYFVWPALQAGALYQGVYPLATALSRPLMAKLLVDVAREEGATAVAHGCTGKGNDQVRFDVSVNALAPDLKIVAPAREWGMTREELIAYAERFNIPVPVKRSSPYSIDENIWGRSAEAGLLEDPWQEPPEDAYEWTVSPADAPAEPEYVSIEFKHGLPVRLGGSETGGLELVKRLNELGGRHGVGRIDHVEDRLVGIKSREVYEAPAAVILHTAHHALEGLTLSKQQLRMKAQVAQEYADLVYNGLWFTAHHQDLAAYVHSTQRHVTGEVRLKLHRGQATVAGRQSPRSLYDYALATYDKGDSFDQSAAVGFIRVWGLPVQVQARTQLLADKADALPLLGENHEG
jgi:argininosuccinate synthase